MFNEDFYPTPDTLIQKMINKLSQKELSYISNILDPSVWKWNILQYMKKNIFEFRYNWKINFYWIEIEYQLRELAKNHCTILDYDFLTFNSLYKFDLIIANFPFSEWVKHFLKAWQILDWWILLCLVNAETLKNPYSEERKLMLKIIEDNNGEVEYLENEFLEAERKTKVEVALIKIKKESKVDWYFKEVEKDYLNDYKVFDEWLETEITQGNNTTDHLLRLNKILKKETINLYKAQLRYNHYVDLLNTKDWFRTEKIDLNERVIQINKHCWIKLFKETDFAKKFTSKSYNEFIKEYEQSAIDFTVENLDRIKTIMYKKQGEAFTSSILEVFDIFTKYYPENREHIEGWQHNSAFMIWKKVILPYFTEDNRSGWRRITRQSKEKIKDIEKVICYFSWDDYEKILSLANIEVQQWETTFFKFKMYKKWTLHLEFKNKEALQKLNLYVCAEKKWLIPTDFKFKIK